MSSELARNLLVRQAISYAESVRHLVGNGADWIAHIVTLADESQSLRTAIEEHRAQKADDRCIEDDDKLYEALGDGIKCDRRVGDKYEMLGNCARFIDRRCEGGGWPSYVDLEKELTDAHNALSLLGAPSRHYTEIMQPSGLLVPASRTLTERIKAIMGR